MPSENYNFDYEPSGTFVDINKECYTFDQPVDVERKLSDVATFRAQTYYRTNFVLPNRCCCGSGGCGPEPTPPVPPGPCPPPEPTPCPEPDIPEGCFEGVYCNNILYQTIAEALEDNPCADEVIVGCGVYELIWFLKVISALGAVAQISHSLARFQGKKSWMTMYLSWM